jgi:hypothetical protein
VDLAPGKPASLRPRGGPDEGEYQRSDEDGESSHGPIRALATRNLGKTKSIEELIPWLYLVSTGDFYRRLQPTTAVNIMLSLPAYSTWDLPFLHPGQWV